MRLYLKTKDFSVTQEAFELHHDESLDMLITKPIPESLEGYYESDAYISHTDSKETLFEKAYQAIKRYNLKKKIALIDSFKIKEKTLLDIGAGTGDFLLSAKNAGWKITGVEPNTLAKQNAERKGIPLLSELAELNNLKFDVITLWHVLEHLPNLEEQIVQS